MGLTTFADLLSFLRRCFYCGSWAGLSDPYCEACWVTLLDRSRDSSQQSLLLWSEDSLGKEVRSLVYYLKKNNFTGAFEFLAGEYLLRQSLPKKSVFVPAPPAQDGDRDHAYFWAKALAEASGGELFSGLTRTAEISQKSLSEGERRQVTMACKELPKWQGRAVIFCDDLVTTGSTARAAWRALGQPRYYQICTIARRPRLHPRHPV